MKDVARRKKLVRVIQILNDSYVSHIDGMVDEPKKRCESCGSRKFHVETNIEYLEALRLLHELLK